MKKQPFPFNMVLQDIRSALNVGAIFRTCDAVNIKSLYLTGITPYPPHNRIPKTALGATESVSWIHEKNTAKVIRDLKKKGNKIVSVEISPKALNVFDYNFSFPSTLILGNEISGVSEEILNISDDVVYLPMYGIKESLNVATTAGIVLYEILRQYNFSNRIDK